METNEAGGLVGEDGGGGGGVVADADAVIAELKGAAVEKVAEESAKELP